MTVRIKKKYEDPNIDDISCFDLHDDDDDDLYCDVDYFQYSVNY